MNILVLGASGFVGSHVTRLLLEAGHDILCGVRNEAYTRQLFPRAKIIYCNFLNDQRLDEWLSHLQDVDVIINCIGIFYHPNESKIWKVHYYTPRTIYEAAQRLQIKKIIHISALGTEQYPSAYAKSKQACEVFLESLSIPSIILKPSLIYGPQASGGITLMSRLAALPFIIPLPGQGKQCFQPIHIDDLSQSILHFVTDQTCNKSSFAAVSPAIITLKEMLITLRSWLFLPQAWLLPIPFMLIMLLARMGNLKPYSLMNTTAIKMLSLGNQASPVQTEAFVQAMPFSLSNFKEGLAKSPSTQADRWYSRLFSLKPLLRLSLAFMWLLSAVTSAFLYPKSISYHLLGETGIPTSWQPTVLSASCLLNGLIGLSLLFNIKVKYNCVVQIGVILIYTLLLSGFIPSFWLEPFGPLAKNIPILMGILILYVLETD